MEPQGSDRVEGLLNKNRPSLYKKKFRRVPFTEPDFVSRAGRLNMVRKHEGFWDPFYEMGFTKGAAAALIGLKMSDVKHVERNPMEYVTFDFLYNVAYVLDLSIEGAFMHTLRFAKPVLSQHKRTKRLYTAHAKRNKYIAPTKEKDYFDKYGVHTIQEILSDRGLMKKLEMDNRKILKAKQKERMRYIRGKKRMNVSINDIIPKF